MKHPIRHYLSKFKYIIALGIFVFTTGFVGENCVVERIKNKEVIAKLEKEIAELEQTRSANMAMLQELQNNPDALRRVAREKYYMKQVDEDVYIIADEAE